MLGSYCFVLLQLLVTRGKLRQLQKLRQEMLNKIDQLKRQNAKLQNGREKIEGLTKHNAELAKESLLVEQNARKEIEEQLKSKLNEIEKLKTQNTEQTMETDNIKRNLEEFRLLIETDNHLEANFTEYTHAELRKVTNDFSDSLKIGEGGFGPVYKAFIGLRPVAIKILKDESSHGNRQFNQEVFPYKKNFLSIITYLTTLQSA
jgi:seryl-tRNA synthetase